MLQKSTMKAKILLIAAAIQLSNTVCAQDSPYKTDLVVDGFTIGGAVGLNALGLSLIQNKSSLSSSELNLKDKQGIFRWERGVAGNYSKQADKDSYIPFYASIAAVPVIVLLNKSERTKAGQILVLFTESMAMTGAVYTLTAGSVNRSRPYVYNTDLPTDFRADKNAQRSFFAGHTATTATATFFAAKVYCDFHTDSKYKAYVWTAAALVPATVAYLRVKAGMHFITDNLIGFAVGATSGILIPELHKGINQNRLTLSPVVGVNYKGLNVTYALR